MSACRETEQGYYTEEGGGELPYLVFFASKGGWPVFEALPTWEDAFDTRQRFAALGVVVQIYHWIQFNVPDSRRRPTTVPAPLASRKVKAQ